MIPYRVTNKCRFTGGLTGGLREVHAVDSGAVRKRYFQQSDSPEEVLAFKFESRVIEGRRQTCLVAVDVVAAESARGAA